MKKIKGLEDKLSPIEELPKGVDVKLPTYRAMFKAAVGNSLGKSGEESIDLYQVGMKLKIEGDSIDLEDAEFKLLREACEKNPAQWTAHYHAQVLMKLKEAEIEKKKPELKEAK